VRKLRSVYALEEHEKANAHSSSSSNGISSTVFQGFIFPFERSNEGPEPFPWLVECFFGRRGMVGENGLLPQGKVPVGSKALFVLVWQRLPLSSSAQLPLIRASPLPACSFPLSTKRETVGTTFGTQVHDQATHGLCDCLRCHTDIRWMFAPRVGLLAVC
jgi:hypothetical protein